MTIRPDVVVFLSDIDLDPELPPSEQRHLDGRPLTHEEIHMLLGATIREVKASLEADQLVLDYEQEQIAKSGRVHELLWRYTLSEDEPVGIIKERMSPADRAEFDQLWDETGPSFELWLNNR